MHCWELEKGHGVPMNIHIAVSTISLFLSFSSENLHALPPQNFWRPKTPTLAKISLDICVLEQVKEIRI
jgi:hypothetical protein